MFNILYNLIIDYNKHTNLTTIINRDDFFEKHINDSLVAKEFILENNISSVIDIGSGAGFPGVPLAVELEKVKFYLVESITKKTVFLEQVKEVLGLKNIEVINKRVEQLDKGFRADAAVSRAVAPLNLLLEYSLPFVKVGGYCIFYKSFDIDIELKDAENALKILNGEFVKFIEYKIKGIPRRLVIIKKFAETPNKYPREKAHKRPLAGGKLF